MKVLYKVSIKILILILVSQLAYFQIACNSGSLISNTKDVITSVQAALPFFTQAGLDSAKLQVVLSIATKLETAIQNTVTPDTVTLVSSLIKAFEDVVNNDLSLIKDQNLRTKVSAVLAIADIALHFIANHISKTVATASATTVLAVKAVASKEIITAINTIENFNTKPSWGKAYKKAKAK